MIAFHVRWYMKQNQWDGYTCVFEKEVCCKELAHYNVSSEVQTQESQGCKFKPEREG